MPQKSMLFFNIRFLLPVRKKKDWLKLMTPKKGTTPYRFVTFMDVLDRRNKHGLCIVVDNGNIPTSYYAVDATEGRGYKPLYVPIFSIFESGPRSKEVHFPLWTF